MGDNQNIELQIPLTAATEATSKTQNQSCTFRRKCFASLIISAGIGIVLAVVFLIPQDPTPPTPTDDYNDPPSALSDDYEDFYENDKNQKSVDNGADPADYEYEIQQTGGYTTPARIKDVRLFQYNRLPI